jgi:hypothetical protein
LPRPPLHLENFFRSDLGGEVSARRGICQSRLVDARRNWLTTEVDLYRALGGSWTHWTTPSRQAESSEECSRGSDCPAGKREPLVHLVAAVLAAQTPLTEVLTVIGQHVVPVFAYTSPGTPHDFIGVEVGRAAAKQPHRVTGSELRQADLFDRRATQASHQASVLNDSAIPHVDAVVRIDSPGRNEVTAWLE